MRSVVCIPLVARNDQLVGTLSVLFGRPHRSSELDLRLLGLLARQAADFLERTRTDKLLRATRQQLADANADLERKVEERTAKLREAIADLEHVSYSMVHDMRAPLRAMQSFASILQEECPELRDSRASEYIRRIRESAKRLDRLITDALNYNKVVLEQLPLEPVDLGELLRGMVRTYPNLEGAEISIEFGELVVVGNESLLTQCFGNLLDNAVKFIAPGVKPRVRVWAKPSTIDDRAATSICVEDNGVGIPKAGQEKIFRMFQRMHAEHQYPGTGVGLAIVRKAVERMAGRLALESEPGTGSRFRVELPTEQAAGAQKSLARAA
jgi:signal transduction histidine kinase